MEFNFKNNTKMIKKLLLLTIIFTWILFNWNVFADARSDYQQSVKEYNEKKDAYDKQVSDYDQQINRLKWEWNDESAKYLEEQKKSYIESESKNLESAKSAMESKQVAAQKEREEKCAESTKCIDQETFMIDTWDIFGGISGNKPSDDTNTGTNILLGTVIQKLMVALGILSVLIMTVWGGYIILYHGQDELLSKGKSIFMSGIIALVIALSSYMIVGLLRFILYNN